MKVIAVTNQKGGVGKTTTAQALGDLLHDDGKSVLYIDLDPQGNLSFTMAASGGAFETLLNPANIAQNITSTGRGDIIASSPALVGADTALTQVGKEYRLKEALERVNYDYCIIDTPPALGILSVNALTAAQDVIIPVQADIYSLLGLGQVAETLQQIKRYTNTALNVAGILITRNNGRAIVRRDIAGLLEDSAARMGTKVFNTRIRECTAIVEAQANRKSIYEYAPKSNAVKDYKAFIEELKGAE